jgi:hypothetical protein
MKVTLTDGASSVTLDYEQLHVLANLFRAYTSPDYESTGKEHVRVDLPKRQINVSGSSRTLGHAFHKHSLRNR